MEKIKREYNTQFVIKYQLLPEEDLDILVSVKSDEDVRYMIEEYVRQIDSGRFSHFHLYLISTTNVTAPSRLHHLKPLKIHTERRYNDMNNGSWRYINGYKSSPTSIAIANEGGPSNFNFVRSSSMQKAHSSPNLRDTKCDRRSWQFQGVCNKHRQFLRIDNRGKQFLNNYSHPYSVLKPL